MKNKKLKSLLCIFLAMFTLSGTACGEDSSSVEETVPETKKFVWDEGTHIFNATDTEYDFVKDGATEYRLVIPEEDKMLTGITAAKSEFITFFKEATGITIPAITDLGLTHSDSNKYISLGNTTLAETAGIEVDAANLTWEGTQIDTVGQTVFITGGSDYGVVYGVYDFMSIMFDYEFYFLDTYDINKGVRNAKLKDFDVTDIPDFEFRCHTKGYMTEPTEGMNGFRYRMPYSYGTVLVPIHEKFADRENLVIDFDSARKTGHNTMYAIPKKQYQAEHPGWYSTAGEQLCYTARGDEAERLLLAKEIADKIKACFKAYTPDKYPLKNIATCSIEDNGDVCNCDACVASTKKYGEPVAPAIQLMNIVNDDVQAWMKEQVGQPWYREEVYTMFFAYAAYKMGPAHYDETKGEYVPNDPSLKCGKGLMVWECPAPFDHQQNLHAEINSIGTENVQKWAALCDEIFYWTKATNFKAYLAMYDTFGHYTSEAMQFFRANSGKIYFQQMQGGQKGSTTAFHNLKSYLNAKLAWNCTLDYTDLIDAYFEGMYKEAADTMKNLWLQERYYAAQIGAKHNLFQHGATIILNNKKFWNYNVLNSWIQITSKALDEVSHYETSNPKLYKVLKKNIESEFISPAYYTLEYFSSAMSEKGLKELRTRFKEACYLTNITLTGEGSGTLEDYVRDF